MITTRTPASPVMAVPPAAPIEAARHFRDLLAFETDCWDVQDAISGGDADFILLDVRSPEAYAAGHIPGADCLPHRRISVETLAAFTPDAVFVVYCAGPHCNGADRGALRLADLGREVKKMIGGVTGWLDEGFTLTPPQTDPAQATDTDTGSPGHEPDQSEEQQHR